MLIKRSYYYEIVCFSIVPFVAGHPVYRRKGCLAERAPEPLNLYKCKLNTTNKKTKSARRIKGKEKKRRKELTEQETAKARELITISYQRVSVCV